MVSSWDDARRAFADGAEWCVDLAGTVGDRWEQPGLGDWDVRALVGHLSRALLTVETYLARPADAVEIASAVDYYRATSSISAGPAVAERGREAGAMLGPEPAAAVAALTTRVLPLVTDRDGDELLTTIAGGMRLHDYLLTRVFELAVHGADLAVALDLPPEVPASAAAVALDLVAGLAVAGGLSGPLLLAATGRPGLSPAFSVL